MKILIVAFDFKPNSGGIAEYTHQLAAYLQSGGDSVLVVAPNIHPTGDAQFDREAPYRVKRFDYRSSYTLGRGGRRRSVCSALMDAVRDHLAELILNNSAGDLASYCWYVARRNHIPLYLLAHGRDVNRSIPLTWRMKQWIVLRGAAKVFCNSSYTADAAIKRGVRPERIAVVNPGVSADACDGCSAEQYALARQQLGLTGRKVILTIGRLVERKGHAKIVEALPVVRNEVPDVLYVIVGDGPCLAAVEKRVKELALEDCVRFEGYVSDEAKPSYYDAADVFAMPSREMPDGDVEGFGMVFLEANAHGKPVVGGRSGGVGDAIDHGRSGFLVDPLNVEEIAAGITPLLKDGNVARRMGEWGRQRVLNEFTWETVASRLRAGLQAGAPVTSGIP